MLANGWAYVGEVEKYIPVSGARTRGVTQTDRSIQVFVKGVPSENITLGFVNVNADSGSSTGDDLPIVTIKCVFTETGTLRVSMPAGTCLDS